MYYQGARNVYGFMLGCLTALGVASEGAASRMGEGAPATARYQFAVLPFSGTDEVQRQCRETAQQEVIRLLQRERLAVATAAQVAAAAREAQLDLENLHRWSDADYQKLSRLLGVQYLVRGTLSTKQEEKTLVVHPLLGDDLRETQYWPVRFVLSEARLRLFEAGGGGWTTHEVAVHTDREKAGVDADAERLARKMRIANRDATRHATRKLLSTHVAAALN